MRTADRFYVFGKWKAAKLHAFGSQNKPSQVPAEDKDAYSEILEELHSAAEAARAGGERLKLKPMRYSATRGSRGHRPVDLWVSVCGVDSDAFGEFPQVYAIASERGLELGFAASIDETDYHNPQVKARNRARIPLLNSKLPGPDEPLVRELDQVLATQGGWGFHAKTRLVPGDLGWDSFPSLAAQLSQLKRAGAETGGGTVCRTFPPGSLADVDVAREFLNAMRLFEPLIARCAPTPWDVQVVRDEDLVAELADETAFDPAGVTDGRTRILAAVARRQGQASFRKALFKAYDGRCAMTGTHVPSVLQAAHITPYLGAATNHVTNGLLLRADVHTLFDLRLLRIDPDSRRICVSAGLRDTPYGALEGQVLASPGKRSEWPSTAALRQHFEGGGAAAELALKLAEPVQA